MNIQVLSRTQKIIVNPATNSVSVINAGPPGPGGAGGGGGGVSGAVDGGRADTNYGSASTIDGGTASG